MGRQNAGVAVGSRAGEWLAVRVFVGCASLWCALGCSNTGEDESSKSPREQCQDFESHDCSQFAACAQSTDRVEYRESCDFSFRVYFPCEKVTFVAGSTQSCLDALDSLACPSSGSSTPTPSACQMLFGTQ